MMHTILHMEFTCDPTKNETNIRDRSLPLLAARAMFNSEMVVREDTRRVYPERRFIGYQTLINETLRRALATDDLKEALREVIREELHSA